MGFLRLLRPWGFSHEARRGLQGASRAAPGSQVSMRMARGSWSSLSSHGTRLGPQEALKKNSQVLSRVAAGNPGFPRLVLVTSGSFKCASEKSGIVLSWEGPLGTPLGLVQ